MKNRVKYGNISQSLPCHKYRPLGGEVIPDMPDATPWRSENYQPNQCTTNFGKCLNVTHAFGLFESHQHGQFYDLQRPCDNSWRLNKKSPACTPSRKRPSAFGKKCKISNVHILLLTVVKYCYISTFLGWDIGNLTGKNNFQTTNLNRLDVFHLISGFTCRNSWTFASWIIRNWAENQITKKTLVPVAILMRSKRPVQGHGNLRVLYPQCYPPREMRP